jgi:hypothetical protein
MSTSTGTSFQWDSPAVASVRNWVANVAKPNVIAKIQCILCHNITIHKNATLNLLPSTKFLMGNDLTIHVGGRLRITASYAKIWLTGSAEGNVP